MDQSLLMVVAKFLTLLFAIAYGSTYVGRVIQGQSFSQVQMYTWAVSAAAFITLQWLL